jgi:DNA-binding FadR family transcriptional regulator
LPSIEELAKELRVSVSKLREQLEVARFLGLIEVKPRRGMRTLGFSLLPSLRIALRLAMALDPTNFEFFGVLRNHVEAGFWYEAVRTLQPSDKQYLSMLVQDALKQLRGNPVQIPHKEHRDFHLTIFSRLENPFVYAILEAYWDAYEQIGLNVYTDYQYLEEIWDYHKQIAVSIREGIKLSWNIQVPYSIVQRSIFFGPRWSWKTVVILNWKLNGVNLNDKITRC